MAVELYIFSDDKVQLELIVGKTEAKKLLKAEKPVHCFMTEK